MLSQVKNVRITNPLTGTDLVLTWDALIEPGVVGYNIKRALSKEGPYTTLNLVPVVPTTYTDTTAEQQSRTNYWYKVVATDGVDEGIESEAVVNVPLAKEDTRDTLSRLGTSPEMTHTRILREMVRRDGLLLRRGGEEVDIYVRKTSGPKCSICYVPERNQPADPACTNCFGTSYEGGYEKYQNILVKIEPMTTRIELMEMGVKLTSAPRAWTLGFPIVNAGDILVRRINNKRYELQGIEQIVSRGILLRQAFTVNEIIRSEQEAIFMLA